MRRADVPEADADAPRGVRIRENGVRYQVGFEDASVFSRAFKRWVGRSPKSYRE